jgi:hypothetical protein
MAVLWPHWPGYRVRLWLLGYQMLPSILSLFLVTIKHFVIWIFERLLLKFYMLLKLLLLWKFKIKATNIFRTLAYICNTYKSKAVPLPHAGAKGERDVIPKYYWPRHEMGWVISVTPQLRLTPGERTPLNIVKEAGWASKLLWTQGLEGEFFVSAGDRTSVVQSVVTHYTDWATLTHIKDKINSWKTITLNFTHVIWNRNL